MPHTLMLAWASPAPEAEQEFHTWYESVHIPQVTTLLPVPGGVQRYQLVLDDGAPRYLAVYDLGENVDPAAAAAALGAATQAGDLDMTKAMDTVDNPPQIQFVTSLP
ncbi:hypothetical protein ACFXJ5_39425 [Streptomyces sp. NPDC059373]